MDSARRYLLLLGILAPSVSHAQQQPPGQDDRRNPTPDVNPDEDTKLPNGKSQKDAISKQAHQDALKEVESLIRLAEDLRDELKRSSEYVVAISSLKKTEEIEKLARQIRGKLKA
jgi:Zn-dependent oligopeptidase